MSVGQPATATVDEFVTALQQLSDNDLRKLYGLAQIRATGLNLVDGGDLLHEAISRVLNGNRRWPRAVQLTVFLRETMRSIASDHWRRREAAVVITEADVNTSLDVDQDISDMAVDNSTNPERTIVAADVLLQDREDV